MRLNFTDELVLLMKFTGETAAAIRMYTTYSGGSPSEYLGLPYDPERDAVDLMFLADALHHFNRLGLALQEENDIANLIRVCDELSHNFSHYDIDRPQFGMRQVKQTFGRWEHQIDLNMARKAIVGIRSKAVAALNLS